MKKTETIVIHYEDIYKNWGREACKRFEEVFHIKEHAAIGGNDPYQTTLDDYVYITTGKRPTNEG